MNLVEKQEWYNLAYRWENKGVCTFRSAICPKVNLISMTGVRTHLLQIHGSLL